MALHVPVAPALPHEQLRHEDSLGSGWNLPLLHEMHDVRPLLPWYFPLSHEMQLECPEEG